MSRFVSLCLLLLFVCCSPQPEPSRDLRLLIGSWERTEDVDGEPTLVEALIFQQDGVMFGIDIERGLYTASWLVIQDSPLIIETRFDDSSSFRYGAQVTESGKLILARDTSEGIGLPLYLEEFCRGVSFNGET